MEPLFTIIRVMTYVAYVIVALALWQISKGRNKRIIYALWSGFAIEVAFRIVNNALYYLMESNSYDIENAIAYDLKLASFGSWIVVIRSVGIVIFAWGFLLLAKEYRKGIEDRSNQTRVATARPRHL